MRKICLLLSVEVVVVEVSVVVVVEDVVVVNVVVVDVVEVVVEALEFEINYIRKLNIFKKIFIYYFLLLLM